jgi:hypothetical protein
MDRPKARFPKPLPQGEVSFFEITPEERFFHPDMPRIVEMFFPQNAEDNPYGYPDGAWAVAGGVSWPMHIEDEGLVGIAHVAGFHLETRTIWFFGERKFIVVAPNVNYPADAPRPLKYWLQANYEQFHARTYYYQEHVAVANKFVLSNIRAFPHNPRPHFAPFPWVEMSAAMQTMHEYVALDRLRIPDSRLDRELIAYDADPGGEYPALFSATVLVNALDRSINSEYLITKVTEELRSF